MNNSVPRRKSVLVTITPYTEQEKRVVNGSTSTSTVPPPPAPPPLPLLSKTRSSDDAVEMQSIESFKLKDTPNPVVPKPPPTYFSISNPVSNPVPNPVSNPVPNPVPNPASNPPANGSPRHAANNSSNVGSKVQNNKEQSTSPNSSETPKSNNIVSSTNGGPSLKPTGKVAIRIGAYEGEAKQPSRLDFLSQQPRIDKNGTEELASGPVVSRLQNELAATLQRSNLRRKTEGDSPSAVKPIPENSAPSNEATNSEAKPIVQGNVEKLASALNNKVTIKVNPENNSR